MGALRGWRVACAVFTMGLIIVGAGCMTRNSESAPLRSSPPTTKLTSRPIPSARQCAPGEYDLAVAPGRRALMRVTRRGRSPARALLLALHGAGSGGAPGGLWAFHGAWDVPGLVIVAPSAAGTTWTLGQKDVRFVDRALHAAFARCQVNAMRVAVGGFSAGAGLALWLGLTNGNLFRAIIALSGGGSLPRERVGRPTIFVAHGVADKVIPIAYGGDAIVRQLRSEGYRVTYRRFAGGHRPIPAIARSAVVSTLYGG
jgi:phospholipase/carboxylesterase